MSEQKVISILSDAFDGNLSCNHAIIQDKQRKRRLYKLIEYSLEISKLKGELYLNESQTAAALLTYSFKKVNFFNQALLNLKLIANSVGLLGINKVLSREKYIKSYHPKTDYIYLWFIGTDTSSRKKGDGSKLLNEIITKANQLQIPIYLETSMKENLPFYRNNGFEIYHEKEIDKSRFVTYFIRRKN